MSNQKSVTIVVADPQKIYREGLKIFLHEYPTLEVAGEASNSTELIQVVADVQPNIIISDLAIAGDEPSVWIEAITNSSDSAIIATSNQNEEPILPKNLCGFVRKDEAEAEIYKAINEVVSGKTYFKHKMVAQAPGLSNEIAGKLEKNNPGLCRSEEKVIEHICEDLSCKEIAGKMFLSIRTVEGYRQSIFKKIGVKGTAGIIKYAIKKGIFRIN